MARIKEYDVDPDNVDADGIAVTQTATGAGSLTLTATGGLTLDYGHQIGITNTGDNTSVSFVVTGTDPDGYSLTETVAGVSDAVAESTEYFKTVSSVTNSAAITGGAAVGTVDELVSKTIPINWRSDVAATVNVDVTAMINWTLEETFDDVQRPGQADQSAYQNSQWLAVATSGAADNTLQTTLGATAIRLKVNSFTTGGELQFNVMQPSSRII